MIVDFKTIKEEHLSRFKGGEKEMVARMYSDGKCKIMKAYLPAGASIGLHTHETNSEIFLLTKGVASVLYDGQTLTLHEGEVHYCPKGHSHSVKNDSEERIEFTAIIPEQ